MTEYEKCLQGLPFDGAQPPMSDMARHGSKVYETSSGNRLR